MPSLSKKILSAFVELKEDKTEDPARQATAGDQGKPKPHPEPSAPSALSASAATSAASATSATSAASFRENGDDRFRNHFDQLFAEANIAGPDYFEFSKMIDAMQAIPNEQARYHTAFVGLQVQGMDKARLLSTAEEYLRVLATDADRFHTTVNSAMQEKVQDRKKELDQKADRIRTLTEEIGSLQQQIASLQAEVRENEGKIAANSAGYAAESDGRKARIQTDIEKIRNYIQ